MIVIIEGLDCCGKTTLSKRFAEKYNFEYIKESYTDDNNEKVNRIKLLSERLSDSKNYIYDRTTLIDDFVYDFLNKEKSVLHEYLTTILSLLSKCKIVHLTLDEEIREQRLNERGDKYITNDMIKQINENYFNFYTNISNVRSYELTGDIEQDVDQIMEVIKND
ncbi:AAA family ATPase [bacterium]|nr:AAA family ATPase [bacterium]